MKNILKILYLVILFSGVKVYAGELKTSLFQFDTAHDDQQSASLGFNYSFDGSYETPIGKVRPLVGMFVTENYSAMAYAGAKIDYKIKGLTITPSFAPGLYGKGSDKHRKKNKGGSKDLGHILEFKSQIDIGLDVGSYGLLSFGLSHISNGDIADKNPGVNNYHFNFVKQF